MAKIPERKSVKDKYKWNLCDLVNGDEAWEENITNFQKSTVFAGIQRKTRKRRRPFGISEKQDEIAIDLIKVYCYSSMSNHQDLRVKNIRK